MCCSPSARHSQERIRNPNAGLLATWTGRWNFSSDTLEWQMRNDSSCPSRFRPRETLGHQVRQVLTMLYLLLPLSYYRGKLQRCPPSFAYFSAEITGNVHVKYKYFVHFQVLCTLISLKTFYFFSITFST